LLVFASMVSDNQGTGHQPLLDADLYIRL